MLNLANEDISIMEGTSFEFLKYFHYTTLNEVILKKLKLYVAYGHQPLYNIILFYIEKIFHLFSLEDKILIFRYLSIIINTFSTVFIFIIAKSILSHYKAIIITTIFAFHPVFHFYAIQAEPYSLYVFFSLLNIIAFLYLNKNTFFKILYFFTLILGFFTHLFFLFIFIAQWIFIFYFIIFKKKLHYTFYKQFLLFAFFLLFFIPFLVETFFYSPLKSDTSFYPVYYTHFSLFFKKISILFGILWQNSILDIIFATSFTGFLFYYSIESYQKFKKRKLSREEKRKKIIFFYITWILFTYITLFILFEIFYISKNFTYINTRHYMILIPTLFITLIFLSQYSSIKKSFLYFLTLFIIIGQIYSSFNISYKKENPDFKTLIQQIEQEKKDCNYICAHNNIIAVFPIPWTIYYYNLYKKELSHLFKMHQDRFIRFVRASSIRNINNEKIPEKIIIKRLHQFLKSTDTHLLIINTKEKILGFPHTNEEYADKITRTIIQMYGKVVKTFSTLNIKATLIQIDKKFILSHKKIQK